MHRVWLRAVLGILLLPLVSCGLFRKAKPATVRLDTAQVGNVDMVNGEQKFILIHSPERVPLAAETVLTTQGEAGDTGRVKVSPERKGSYLTADIVSGHPKKGDAVVWHRVVSPEAAALQPSARVSVPKADSAETPVPAPLP